MLQFELDVVAADLARRTIEGVAVPYGEVGTIAGRKYRFAPGSLELARTRTPLLVDHDRGRPVGVLAELVDSDRQALARFTIDTTQDGDTALVQAASGSRGSLSVGAELVEAQEGTDGVIDVARALIHEVSLLALGAFTGATVTRVAAEADEPDEPAEPADDDELEPEPEPDPDQTELELDDKEEDEMTEATSGAPVILAAADRPERELSAGELVGLMVRAQQGERDARRMIEAALAESISTDVAGLLPPSYERTVLGGKEVNRPLYNTFRGKPLPGVGLLVSKPKWTTPPDGAWATDVNADATTNKVVIGSQTADVIRWDWGGAFPYVVVQRSSPDLIDSVYAELVQDFYLDVEAKIGGEITAAAPGTATSLGAAIAEFYTATGNSRSPEVIIMAPDVWGAFADTGALSVAIGQGGVSGGDLTTSFAGIPAIVSGTLAPGETVLATRRAIDARVTEPVRLTANAIGALNVELGVVGEGLFDTDYPAELLKFAAVVPATALGGGGGSRRSS